MTDQLRQAAQQALEALDTLMIERESIYDKAIAALRTALEQQQQAEPVAWNAGVAPMWPQQKEGETFSVSYTTTPQPEQQAEPVQEQKYEKRIAPYSTTLSMILNTTPPQRPWVGLTDEEVQFCAAQHRQLVNAHYDAASDINVITAAFEATVFYETVEQALKERNHD